MAPIWIALIVVGIVVAVIAIWAVVIYNRFIRLANDIEEAASTIKVYEKKRFDLVPNLVTTVKGYAAHETEIFDSVTKARERVLSAKTPAEREEGEQQLSAAMGRLFAVAEAYPDLKASANFLDLQNQLGQIESEIASARKYYNANVKLYNTQLLTWPTRIIARRHGFTKKELYDVPDQAQTENIHVAF